MNMELEQFSPFKKRRQKLISGLKNHEAVILFSKPVYYRQRDIIFPFRQDSFFYYLTGFEEFSSCLVLKNTEPFETLFVQSKNKEKELWDGPRWGPEKAKETFLMDACEAIENFEKKISLLLDGVSKIYHIPSVNEEQTTLLRKLLINQQVKAKTAQEIKFAGAENKISEMRMIKSRLEAEKIKKACEVSSKAHQDVMKTVRPGINERHLHGEFLRSIMKQGAARESYSGIFASGRNALILHYVKNDQTCAEGDLILVDAGAEWDYYASDISRTFPVNGRFSPPQKVLYNHLLNVQKQIINMVRPGISFKKIQSKTRELLFECLKTEGILPPQGRLEDVSRFFPHNFGHLLGLDVHDVHCFENNRGAGRLQTGMVLTVEPGLYIPLGADRVPEKFQGMGIRIEDNVLVTEDGVENLSQGIPKEVEEIESLMAR